MSLWDAIHLAQDEDCWDPERLLIAARCILSRSSSEHAQDTAHMLVQRASLAAQVRAIFGGRVV